MYILIIGQVWRSKNDHHEIPYTVIGGIKLAGSKETPKRICTDRIIGTR
jgi:hypothetical protein